MLGVLEVLTSVPNRKNTVYWCPSNPHIVPCKKTHGEKVKAGVGIVDGKCLPVDWFEGSVKGTVPPSKKLSNPQKWW